MTRKSSFKTALLDHQKASQTKIYIKNLGTYINGQTLGIHINEGVGKLGYMYIQAQPSVYATKSCSTALPVPTNPGATVVYPSGNLTVAIILAKTRAHE